MERRDPAQRHKAQARLQHAEAIVDGNGSPDLVSAHAIIALVHAVLAVEEALRAPKKQ